MNKRESSNGGYPPKSVSSKKYWGYKSVLSETKNNVRGWQVAIGVALMIVLYIIFNS